MTHRLLTQQDSINRMNAANAILTYKPLRLYSLYKLNGSRWERCSDCSYSEKIAYRVFGERLAVNPLAFRIRALRASEFETNEAK